MTPSDSPVERSEWRGKWPISATRQRGAMDERSSLVARVVALRAAEQMGKFGYFNRFHTQRYS